MLLSDRNKTIHQWRTDLNALMAARVEAAILLAEHFINEGRSDKAEAVLEKLKLGVKNHMVAALLEIEMLKEEKDAATAKGNGAK